MPNSAAHWMGRQRDWTYVWSHMFDTQTFRLILLISLSCGRAGERKAIQRNDLELDSHFPLRFFPHRARVKRWICKTEAKHSNRSKIQFSWRSDSRIQLKIMCRNRGNSIGTVWHRLERIGDFVGAVHSIWLRSTRSHCDTHRSKRRKKSATKMCERLHRFDGMKFGINYRLLSDSRKSMIKWWIFGRWRCLSPKNERGQREKSNKPSISMTIVCGGRHVGLADELSNSKSSPTRGINAIQPIDRWSPFGRVFHREIARSACESKCIARITRKVSNSTYNRTCRMRSVTT